MVQVNNCGRFGLQHQRGERVVDIEFNLSELYDLLAMIPLCDGFRKDIQAAIDAIEKKEVG